MRVLITGAAGFVGTHMIQALKNEPGNHIFAWAKDRIEAEKIALSPGAIEVIDITKESSVRESIKKIRPDVIYHLAAQSSVGLSWKIPALTYEVNIIGTVHILEAVLASVPKAAVLLVGSAEQYGKVGRDEMPIKESRVLEGTNPYSVSKMTQEAIARLYVEHKKLNIIMVRAFNHIGPGQSTKFVIPDWCNQIAAIEHNEQEPVLYVGNIQVRRDFTDVRDIVKAYIALAEKGKAGEVYNVGSGKSYSLQQVLDIILECSLRNDIIYEVDQTKIRPADLEELVADVSKLKDTVQWEPKIDVQQSIKDILVSIRNKGFSS